LPKRRAIEENRALSVNSVLNELEVFGDDGVSLAFPKDRYRLHAMLSSAGHEDCEGRTYDWHGLKRGDAPFVLLQHTTAAIAGGSSGSACTAGKCCGFGRSSSWPVRW
jgi:hypothetical protein